jgi:DNA-binding NarL/FixJ family response regulator
MQLILAIDSDPRRAEQLATLVQARLTVDLVQATSAGEGLHALQDRIPDLILTSPLLSPFDDGVLDEYLRDLGAAGAHVQTVRIPVLSVGHKKAALAKRLFLLGRQKATSAATPDGCDPKVFADEIAAYLSRAAGARQSVAAVVEALSPRQEAPPNPEPARPVVGPSTPMRPELIEEFTDAIELADTTVTEQQYAWSAEAQYEAPERLFVETPEPLYVETPEPLYTETPEPRFIDDPEPPYVRSADLTHERSTESTPLQANDVSPFDQSVASEPAMVETMRDEAAQVTMPEPNRKGRDASATFEAALAAIRAAWVKPDASVAADSSSVLAAPPLSATRSHVNLTGRSERTGPTIDGLAEGAPGRNNSKASVQADGGSSPTLPTQSELEEAKASERPPMQDEWGIFDPDQCGFPAVAERLDEIAESKKTPHRAGVTSRVVSIR